MQEAIKALKDRIDMLTRIVKSDAEDVAVHLKNLDQIRERMKGASNEIGVLEKEIELMREQGA
jgi:hypothetical protein